jgi:hypothetical protein
MKQRPVCVYRVFLARCRTFYPDYYPSFCTVVPKREFGEVAVYVAAKIR